MSTVFANLNPDDLQKATSATPPPTLTVHVDSSNVTQNQKVHLPAPEPGHGFTGGVFKSPVLPSNRRCFKDLAGNIEAVQPPNLGLFYSRDDFLVFDIRPFNDYVQKHLKNSINLCVPLTLLKRKLYGLESMLKSIDPQQRLQMLKEGSHSTILIYDFNSSKDQISLAVYQTCTKFAEYSASNNVSFKVYFLDGGLKAASNDQDLIEYGSPTAPTSDRNSDQSLLSPADLWKLSSEYRSPISPAASLNFSGFFLPSSTPAQQKFLSSIKRNPLPKLDLSGISGRQNLLGKESSLEDESMRSYNHQLKIPDLRGKEDKIPKWLQFFNGGSGQDDEAKNHEVLSILNLKFSKIERAELVRLKKAISSANAVHSPNICSPGNLCPACDQIVYKLPKGIEYGYKNRYNNVWPFEHSRVKLSQASPLVLSPCCTHDEQDDYFNANHIDSPGISDLKYIATQNPLQSTYDDFWRTVWINGIEIVVCLNKQQENFGQLSRYFDDQEFTGFKIATKSTTDEGYFIVRELALSRKGKDGERKVYHLEFKDWPDFGVPSSFESILALIDYKTMLIEKYNLKKCSVIHCSAGCGRTGCFITLDLIIDCFRKYQTKPMDVDPWGEKDLIYRIVQGQRRQRISMVQTLDQFIVCYEIILDYIVRRMDQHRMER